MGKAPAHLPGSNAKAPAAAMKRVALAPAQSPAKAPRLVQPTRCKSEEQLQQQQLNWLQQQQHLDLRKVPQVQDTDAATESSDTKTGCKFDRAKQRVSLMNIFLGYNLEAEISNLRKLKAFAKRESPDFWFRILQDHESFAVGAAQMVMTAMMAQRKWTTVLEVAVSLKGACSDNKLPKQPWVDYCIVSQAMRYISPWVVGPKLDGSDGEYTSSRRTCRSVLTRGAVAALRSP